MIAAALLVPLLAAEVPAAQDGIRIAELRLTGPLREVTLENAGSWRTRVTCDLAPGEVRTVRVPLATSDAPRDEPELRLLPPDGPGDAVLVALAAGEDPFTWSALPAGLRARSWPPLRPARPRPDAARLALVAGALCLGLALGALGRRRTVALAVGALACAAPFVLPARAPAALALRVHEGDAESGEWLRVDGAREILDLRPGALGWAESLPFARERSFEVTLETGGALRWALSGKGLALYFCEHLSAFESFEPRSNEALALAACWTRDAAGAWTARGAWAVGAPLPPPGAGGGEAPPGWLAAGLPQGVGVLLGRVARDGSEREGGRLGFVRLVGFPEESR